MTRLNKYVILAPLIVAVTSIAAGADGAVPVQIDFAREVLPILSEKCFVCHGPDTKIDETDFRLDSFEAATEDRGGYRAIDPENPDESELLARIHSEDDPMPPESAKPLSVSERDLITRWVKQGGMYAKHWAFVLPEKERGFPSLAQAIDTYIGEKLTAAGINFSPAADRATLARRVALVLTGLPPEPDQLQRYLKDESDGSYDRLVDELLASPRLGEHQARYWLDAVRYGDTHGLHLDNRRGIYPYRDWVVRALNENLPLDDFITWQLAGDLLPNPTLAQQVATGFVRLNPSTGEGGAIADEFQMKNNFDRVETLGTVFLGLSLTCARCHTHKYDPIEQTEYYRLLAFFNNTAEPALDGNSYTYGPTARVPENQSAWDEWTTLTTESNQLLAKLPDAELDVASLVRFAQQRSQWSTSQWRISKPVPADDPNPPATTTQIPDAQWSEAKGLPGIISQRDARGKLPNENQVVWVAFEVEVPVEQTIDITFGGADGSYLLLDDANVPAAEKQNGLQAVHLPLTLWPGKHQVRIAINGHANMSQLQVTIDNRWDPLAKTKDWSSLSVRQQLRILADEQGPLGDPDQRRRAAELAHAIGQAEANFTTTLVARELTESRPTRMLKRGEYDLPVGDPLSPDVLKVLNPLPEGVPRNRLALARWLTSSDHPMVPRVLVNRIWQRTFGRGLVRTPEEFGLQGGQPTHPELLDWIAVDLHESGWNLKQLLREMVTSRTFRQRSAWRTDIDDPENRLLARASSYRMDAEVLRDVGLWASGLLDTQMGGEGVKPYQPAGMWAALAHPGSNTKDYSRDKGTPLYRRSLYVYWKRTSPHPMMTLFDAPDRESSCVRRSRTNTPLQSLGMLNETQRVEMARALAQRLMQFDQKDDARIDRLFRMLACRDASEAQREASVHLLDQLRRRYAGATADAEALLQIGDAARDPSLDPAEHAAWTQLAITILASDIAIVLY